MKSIIVVFVLILTLVGCTRVNEQAVSSLAAEDVIKNHFKYINEKDTEKLEKTVTHAKKEVTWEFEKLEYFKLISIEEDKSEKMKDAYMSRGRGSVIKPFQVKVFKVNFEVNYKGGGGSGFSNGNYSWYYFVIKEKEGSDWLIDDWGV